MSVTHGVVPTVTKALQYSRNQDSVCEGCFNGGHDCDKCEFTSEADYYTK